MDKKIRKRKGGDIKSSASKAKQSKKNLDKKSVDPGPKKFAFILPETVSAIADSIGITELSDDVRTSLAEDVSYKLREVVQNCSIALRNNKRQKLLTSDVTRVFESSNTPNVYGHSTSHGLDYIYVSEADVFLTNDVEVDIRKMVLSKTEYIKSGEEYIKGSWVLPDPLIEKPTDPQPQASSNTSSNNTNSPQPKPIKPEEQTLVSKPPPHFINYYLQVARVVIGGSEPHLKVALADLKRNPKIGPLTPYFLNLVALTVNKLQRHYRLTDALLRTIEALVDNQFVDPSSHLAVNRAVNALLVIAIEPKIATRCDDLMLRKRAALLLNKVLVYWRIELKQQMDIVRRLLQLLLDANISLKSHYGAIVTLTALGNKTLDSYFFPIVDRYFPLLEEKENNYSKEGNNHSKEGNNSNHDIHYVQGAVLMAAERMYRRTKTLNLSVEEVKRLQKVDEKLYEYFGDTLIPHRTDVLCRRTCPRKTIILSESDAQHPVRNDSIFSDHDNGLKNCNMLTMIPRHLQMTYNLNFLNTHSQKNVNSKYRFNIQEVFSFPEHYEKSKEILFNFVGSNQLSSDYIRKKHLDSSQLYFNQTSRFSRLWLHQNLFKNTRCIKYCSPSHLKSNAGDLYIAL